MAHGGITLIDRGDGQFSFSGHVNEDFKGEDLSVSPSNAAVHNILTMLNKMAEEYKEEIDNVKKD